MVGEHDITQDVTVESEGASEAAKDAGYEAPQTQMPAALVVALVAQLVGSFIIRVAVAGVEQSRGFDDTSSLQASAARWEMLGRALPFVCLVLALAGALELLRGSRDRARLGAQIMIGALLVGLAAKLGIELGRLEPSQLDSFDPWTGAAVGPSRVAQWAYAACWPGVTAGLLVAGWCDRGVRWLAAPLLAASIVPGSYAVLDLRHLLGVTRPGGFAVTMMVEIFFVAAFLFTLFRSAPIADPFGGWERAATSLERAGRALRLWLAFSVVELLLIAVLVLFGASSSLLGWLLDHDVQSWGPLGGALAMMLLAGHCLGAAGLVMLDAPRLRLIITGGLLATAATIWALQMTSSGGDAPLAILRPLLHIAGVAMFAASLHGFVTLLNAQAVGKPLSYSITVIIAVLLADAGALQLAVGMFGFRVVLLCFAMHFVAQAFVLIKLRAFSLQIAELLRRREKLPAATLRRS